MTGCRRGTALQRPAGPRPKLLTTKALVLSRCGRTGRSRGAPGPGANPRRACSVSGSVYSTATRLPRRVRRVYKSAFSRTELGCERACFSRLHAPATTRLQGYGKFFYSIDEG